MLTKKDLLKIGIKNENNISKDENDLKDILNFENEYNMNSYDIFYLVTMDEKIKDWQNKLLKYNYLNGNPKKINKIKPKKYIGISKVSSKETMLLFKNFLKRYNENGIPVTTNKNPLNERMFKLLNEKNKIIILLTDDMNDFNKKGKTNVISIYSSDPEKDFEKMCDKILIIEKNNYLIKNTKYEIAY